MYTQLRNAAIEPEKGILQNSVKDIPTNFQSFSVSVHWNVNEGRFCFSLAVSVAAWHMRYLHYSFRTDHFLFTSG